MIKHKALHIILLTGIITFLLFPNSTQAQRRKKIEVYTMVSCGRCYYTVDYLKKKRIHFREYSTSIKKHKQKMWTMLKNQKGYSKKVTMPVIVIDGQVHYNIPDLKTFLKRKIH